MLLHGCETINEKDDKETESFGERCSKYPNLTEKQAKRSSEKLQNKKKIIKMTTNKTVKIAWTCHEKT